MTEQCCVDGPASHRLARRFSRAAASILPGAVLVFLPKCPLCVAAWLTAVTGIGVSAAGAVWLRAMFVVFLATAMALAAAPIVRRRVFGRASAPQVDCTEMPSRPALSRPTTQ